MESNPASASEHQPALPEAAKDLSRSAVGWCLALVLGVGLATWSAVRDRNNHGLLEQAVARTAVGDSFFYPVAVTHPPALSLEGAPLVPTAKQPEPHPEVRMRLVGMSEGPTSYRLYVPVERTEGNGEVEGPSWFVKTGPGLFLRLSR